MKYSNVVNPKRPNWHRGMVLRSSKDSKMYVVLGVPGGMALFELLEVPLRISTGFAQEIRNVEAPIPEEFSILSTVRGTEPDGFLELV